MYIYVYMGYPGGSNGRESACNAKDPGLIPGSESSPEEGNSNPLLGQKVPLKKGIATHSSIVAWRIPWTRSLVVSM